MPVKAGKVVVSSRPNKAEAMEIRNVSISRKIAREKAIPIKSTRSPRITVLEGQAEQEKEVFKTSKYLEDLSQGE